MAVAKRSVRVCVFRERQIYIFGMTAAAVLCLSACGYQFSEKEDRLFSDIKSLNIPFFMNETFEPRVENLVTEALINEFLERGKVRTINGKNPDATVTGTVKSFQTSPISFNSSGRVLEYRATISLDVSLKRNDTGVILWESLGLTMDHEYKVSVNTTTTFDNRREATRKIAEDLAEEIHKRIFEDF